MYPRNCTFEVSFTKIRTTYLYCASLLFHTYLRIYVNISVLNKLLLFLCSFEKYEGESIRSKFPQFNATPRWTSIFQKDSGLVDAAMGNAVHIQLARKYGATILENAAVIRVAKQGKFTKVGYIVIWPSKIEIFSIFVLSSNLHP